MELNLPQARILSFSAHPDDEVGGAGGLLIQSVRAGAAVRLCLCLDPAEPRFEGTLEAERSQRLGEFSAVSQRLGAESSYLGLSRYPVLNEDNLMPVVTQIRQFRPSILLTPSGEENHPDHRAVAALVRTANWQAGRAAFPDCGRPFRATVLLEYETDNPLARPTFLRDISDVMSDKISLLEGYTSQVSRKQLSQAVAGLNAFRGIMYKVGSYAEAYRMSEFFYG